MALPLLDEWAGFMNDDNQSDTRQPGIDWKPINAEQRVNLVRIFGIVGFYLVHFWHITALSFSGDLAASADGRVEQAVVNQLQFNVSILCFGWLMQAVAIHLMIARRNVPTWLPKLATAGDLVWLTLLLCLSTGPGGPMVVGYFLIIMLSGIRFDLRLVRTTTVSAMLGYLVLLGATRWPLGMLEDVKLQSVPPYHEIMILVAMVVSGIIIGQIVRQSYLLDEAYGPRDQEGGA